MPTIELRDLRRTYTSSAGLFAQRRVIREALRGVSFGVEDGELFGLLGPNGAGKTTLVKILATVLLPTSGSVSILGHDVVRDAEAVRGRIGLVFGGERGVYGTLTGRDTLRFWGDLYKVAPNTLRRRVDEVLELVGLRDRADERVETYSRGMKQRLHLARGILHQPRLLLLDEPTIGLDPVAASEIRSLVRSLNDEGMTIFLTTHYMAEAQALCDRVAFINEGQIALIDSPDALTRASGDELTVDIVLDPSAASELRSSLVDAYGVVVDERPSADGLTTLRITGRIESVGAVVTAVAKYGPKRLTTIESTLEDVYIRLLGDRGMRV